MDRKLIVGLINKDFSDRKVIGFLNNNTLSLKDFCDYGSAYHLMVMDILQIIDLKNLSKVTELNIAYDPWDWYNYAKSIDRNTYYNNLVIYLTTLGTKLGEGEAKIYNQKLSKVLSLSDDADLRYIKETIDLEFKSYRDDYQRKVEPLVKSKVNLKEIPVNLYNILDRYGEISKLSQN